MHKRYSPHGDYDHMGEAQNIIDNIKVKNVVFNNDSYNDLELKLIKKIKNKNIKFSNTNNIDIKNIKIFNSNKYKNENDNSNVIYLNIYKYIFLFMGDSGVNREKDILNDFNLNNIDFIKIGHHGSNTLTSKYFIDSINPKYCLISVGNNNRYGHPKDEILDLLESHCEIYRTDINGSIEIRINNNGYKIKTYNP